MTSNDHKNPKTHIYQGVGDSGSTGHYIKLDHMAALTNVRENKYGITVFLPDGQSIKSTHTGELDWPDIPRAARIAHIFPELKGSLISIGLLCEHKLNAKFTKNTLEISNAERKIIMQGTRCPVSKMLLIPLTHECDQNTEENLPKGQNFAAQSLEETDDPPPDLVDDNEEETDEPPVEPTDDPIQQTANDSNQPAESQQFDEESKKFKELVKDSAELKCFSAMVDAGFNSNWALSVQPRRSQQELVNF